MTPSQFMWNLDHGIYGDASEAWHYAQQNFQDEELRRAEVWINHTFLEPRFTLTEEERRVLAQPYDLIVETAEGPLSVWYRGNTTLVEATEEMGGASWAFTGRIIPEYIVMNWAEAQE